MISILTVNVLCSHALVPGQLQLRGQLRGDGSAAAGKPRTLRRPLPRLLRGGRHRQGRQRGDARRLGGGGDGPAGTPDQLMRRAGPLLTESLLKNTSLLAQNSALFQFPVIVVK